MPRKAQREQALRGVYEVIGGNIFRMRGTMTQKELAALAGVSRSTVEGAEKGLGCSLENLLKIARALGCKPQDLFITDEDRKEVSYAHIMLMEKIKESLTVKKE